MKFVVAVLLGLASATFSEKKLLHNQVVALSDLLSEF
jgi:hypothetical protein